MLASWVHVDGEDWRARVASWLPAHGVDAWVVQRDVADPALYVGTWLRDGDADERDPDGAAARPSSGSTTSKATASTGVGFGFVYLRRTDSPSDVLAEDLRHGSTDPLGDEAIDYFRRVEWLRNHDVLGARFDSAARHRPRAGLSSRRGGLERSRRRACTAATDPGGNTRSTTSPPRCSQDSGPTDCRWRTW